MRSQIGHTRSNLGTTRSYGTADSNPMTPVATATYTSTSNGSGAAIRYKFKGCNGSQHEAIYEGQEDSDPEA